MICLMIAWYKFDFLIFIIYTLMEFFSTVTYRQRIILLKTIVEKGMLEVVLPEPEKKHVEFWKKICLLIIDNIDELFPE